jgi:hypothetical protein
MQEAIEKDGGYRLPKTKEIKQMLEAGRDLLEQQGMELIEEQDAYFVKFPDVEPHEEKKELLN